MNIKEYNEVKKMNYEEYCSYLQKKYGIPKKPYFTENYSKVRSNMRTSEGLVIHHKKEDVAIMLTNVIYAKMNPFEYQLPENLVYCDYLEHLLLHVLICEDLLINSKKERNKNELVGVGGVINFIGPELNDLYSGYQTSQEWRKICHSKVIKDQDVYLQIIERFIRRFWKLTNQSVDELTKSYNEGYGKWSKDNNKIINKKIIEMYNNI